MSKNNNLNENEKIQKEIDWLKLSMEIDKVDYTNEFNCLLQNVAFYLVLFFGILSSINISIYYYLSFLDVIHFFLINLQLFTAFLFFIKNYEIKYKNKFGGINNILKEFRFKKCLIKKKYLKMGINLEKTQEELTQLIKDF